MNGTELLTEYRTKRSEEAFTELVRLYTNLVYSVAKRRLLNAALAQEVTKSVFMRLAKANSVFRSDGELVAWLHRTTVNVSIDLWRSEFRRRAREEKAAAMQMQDHENEEAGWNNVAPVLDEALNSLSDSERQAVLLRFFSQKTMRELGVALGVSEDAAKMRISRAVERLRVQLSERGVTCSAVALGGMLADRTIEAAPVSVVAALMCLKFPFPAVVGATGMLGAVLQGARIKVLVGLAGASIVGVTLFFALRSSNTLQRLVPDNTATASKGTAAQEPRVASKTQNDAIAEEGREPDPLKLLEGVARARQKIASGSMAFHVISAHAQNGHMETNDCRLSVLFDGSNLRWEQVGREYAYTGIGDASAPQEERMKKESMDRATAEREGLLRGFEARYVTTYDGSAVMTFRNGSTVIDDPNKGTYHYVFDPRCLGLSDALWVESTVDGALGLSQHNSVKLAGKEFLDGVPAWHVRIESKNGGGWDFWIDAAQPTWVLKQSYGQRVVVSQYDKNNGDALPTEVSTTEYRNGTLFSSAHWTRAETELGVSVGPTNFTLAGLGMPIGTDVSDVRISRGIGYWNGAGLSEFSPRKGTAAIAAPNMAELLALLENEPASPAALDAAAWILLNTPAGPQAEKACSVILGEHTHATNLVYLCKQLERVRPRCVTNLLEAILRDNPSAQVRATAALVLATLRKEEANFGLNKKATGEAEKLFERVIAESASLGNAGIDLTRHAQPELDELHHLLIGMPAPETQGEDLEGQILSLGDYRGKVLVLVFWCCGYTEAVEHRKLLERMSGKPFAMVAFSEDKTLEKARATTEKSGVTWPTIWDGARMIHEQWNVRKWPTTFVLDPKGIIRHRDLRERQLSDAVDALLREFGEGG